MTAITQGFYYDGVNLMTYAYNIRALGVPERVPARRGDNLIIPGKSGRLYVPKKLDQNSIQLAMFVKDTSPDGTTRSPAQLLANLDALKQLFAKPGQRILQYNNGVETRSALVEVVNTVEFQPIAPSTYALVVEFVMAEPYWFKQGGATLGAFQLGQAAIGDLGVNHVETGINTSPYQFMLNNPGTATNEKALISIGGQITNPKVSLGDYWVQYNGTVASGSTLNLDCETWTATLDGEDVTPDISHGGDVVWLPILPGDNAVALSGSAVNDASISISFTIYYI